MYRTLFALAIAASSVTFADASPELKPQERAARDSSFTGKIVGNHVRMRTSPDVDSHIVREVNKGELVVVTGETDDFYTVEPPSDLQGYVFRSFVIDNVIEGNRVNVRLAPDRDAPIIGHLSTGDAVNGTICEENNKWLKITSPAETKFYIAKEFIEYAGKPELKRVQDKRRDTAKQLLESADLLVQTELRKGFNDIDFERTVQGYNTVINDYADFPQLASRARHSLATAQESYINKKINFLEQKADGLAKGYDTTALGHTDSDRMAVWEPLEESLYLTWSAMHHSKTMEDYYTDQRLKARLISGILEAYTDPVRNKPGNFQLKDENGATLAFLYSTQVDLKDLVGQSVSLNVTERPNNNFAFPAYYVLEAE